MNWLLRLIKGIGNILFGDRSSEPQNQESRDIEIVPKEGEPALQILLKEVEERTPYFVQIGLDFGTSYTKCVCRDIITDKAWVYVPNTTYSQELPFLIPSTLLIRNNQVSYTIGENVNYPEGGLYHLKNALSLAAKGNLDDPRLTVFRKAVRLKSPDQILGLIATCTVYFLAGVIGNVRKQIKAQLPDFGSNASDYMAINMAIPVEDAQEDKIRKVFLTVLNESWKLSEQLASHPRIHLKELISLRRSLRENGSDIFNEECFVYPEVSANVQGFVRSRVSSPGTYLFNDTGGGTVDQSIFIFFRSEYSERLSYLAGEVLPLGSDIIEERAANMSGRNDTVSLEEWRKRKERGENHLELQKAKDWIFEGVKWGTERTLALAKHKLYVKKQLEEIRIIYGGGGDCEYPYRKAVKAPFKGQLFREPVRPKVIGMPVPRDLSLKENQRRWMKRLSVAYGLSFEKNELVPFAFPSELDHPKPEEIWSWKTKVMDAPSKDQC